MRLFSVPVVLAALLVFSPARSQAQYTTKTTSSKSSGYTTKRQAAPAKTEEKAAGTPSRKTSRADLFKPRNRPVEDTGEEDLPSFEAMNSPQRQSSGTQSAPKNEGGNAYFQRRVSSNQGSAQGDMQNQGDGQQADKPAGPKKPKGEVWFYVTDFTSEEVEGYTICDLKKVLQNKTDTMIDRLALTMEWSGGVQEHSQFLKVKPKENKVVPISSYRQNCTVMAGKPRITITTCRIGNAINEECKKLIVFK